MQGLIGVQTWSLRHLIQEDPAAVLQQLAAAGYAFIEPAGLNLKEGTLQGFKPQTLLKLATEQGLKIISGHFQFKLEEVEAVGELATSMGMQYVVQSFFQDEVVPDLNWYRQAADNLNRMGEKLTAYGLKLGYHNHAHELLPIDGQIPYNLLLEHTDPRYVIFQPDLGWMSFAGKNAVDYFDLYPGRFPLWHLRDLDAIHQQSTTIGEGTVPFPRAFAARKKAGFRYAIAEMSSDTREPLDKLVRSCRLIANWL